MIYLVIPIVWILHQFGFPVSQKSSSDFMKLWNMHNQQNKILIRKVKNRLHPSSYMEKIVRKILILE